MAAIAAFSGPKESAAIAKVRGQPIVAAIAIRDLSTGP